MLVDVEGDFETVSSKLMRNPVSEPPTPPPPKRPPYDPLAHSFTRPLTLPAAAP